MDRAEVMAALAQTPDDELGDTLLRLAVAWWIEDGKDVSDIQYLVEEVADGA